MNEIPVFRVHTERMKKDKFVAIAAHVGVRGEPSATEEAFFAHDKERALAYAMPGSRFAGLLFFTDASQGLAAEVSRAPGQKAIDDWTDSLLKRFQLLPSPSKDDQVRASFTKRVSRRDAVVEEGEETQKLRRAPLMTEVAFDVRLNDVPVTGPRAKVRLAFKTTKGPAWVHRGLWERLEVFEARRLLTEDEVYRRLADGMAERGSASKAWRLNGMRLAYFAGEFCGGPDLLLPYYFAEVEFREPSKSTTDRQGPRQLFRIRACA